MLYYLNDPEEGGETAFPIADKPDNYVEVCTRVSSAAEFLLSTIVMCLSHSGGDHVFVVVGFFLPWTFVHLSVRQEIMSAL